MSKKLVFLVSGSAFLVLGLLLLAARLGVQYGVRTSGSTPSPIEARLASLQGLEGRLLRLEEEVDRIKNGRVREEGENGAKERGEAGAEPGPEALRAAFEAKVSTLEQRLAGLEGDPVRRGYAFLASENAELRREGVNILRRVARFDPEARAAMRKLLHDPSPRVREQTAQVLGALRDKESTTEMMELLADSEASIRRRAVQALTASEAHEAVAALGERLTSDQDDRVRESAADGLGRLKATQAVEPLLKALKDQSETVRGEAIASLGEVGAREAAPALRSIYDQDPGTNRMRLVVALKSLGDEVPFQREVQRLSQTAEKDENAEARRQAIRELAVLARDSSRQVFSQALLDPSPMVRREAERALGR